MNFTDSQITVTLANIFPHTPFFEGVFSFLSLHGAAITIFLCIGLLVLWYEGRGGRHYRKKFEQVVAFTAFGALTATALNNFVLKIIFARPRPSFTTDILTNFACPLSYSFPSGHAAAAFATATILTHLDHKSHRGALYFGLAALIGYSRIYLGCHYFFDVIAGAVVGIAIGWLVVKFPPFLKRKSHR